jgi:large subunit ribosomal protein L6
LGYSHDINYDIPDGIKIEVEKQTTLKISGLDKQQVGSVASKIKTIEKLNLTKVRVFVKKDNMFLKKKERKNNETKYKH